MAAKQNNLLTRKERKQAVLDKWKPTHQALTYHVRISDDCKRIEYRSIYDPPGSRLRYAAIKKGIFRTPLGLVVVDEMEKVVPKIVSIVINENYDINEG